MATTVEMPQLGETVTEGTILSWAKQVGDSIEADEVLVEILSLIHISEPTRLQV